MLTSRFFGDIAKLLPANPSLRGIVRILPRKNYESPQMSQDQRTKILFFIAGTPSAPPEDKSQHGVHLFGRVESTYFRWYRKEIRVIQKNQVKSRLKPREAKRKLGPKPVRIYVPGRGPPPLPPQPPPPRGGGVGGGVVGWWGGWVAGWLGCGSELVWAWWVGSGLVQGWFRVGLRWVLGGFGVWVDLGLGLGLRRGCRVVWFRVGCCERCGGAGTEAAGLTRYWTASPALPASSPRCG